MSEQTMRAVIHERYGPADLLEMKEVPRPSPGPGEVLVRVHASSLHADVWHVVRGHPYLLRFMGAGILRPKQKIPGTDIAGVVVAAGEGAGRFHPGDEVYGEIVRGHQWHNAGALAEYAVAHERKLAAKPENISFEQAAAVPTSGLIGLQAVVRQARVEEGQKVLVNGAGGGVGTFALQIAKALGAEVTAVDRSPKLERLRSLGADHVLDAEEDFTRRDERYDAIIDIPANHPPSAIRRVLPPKGSYVLIGHDGYDAGRKRLLGSVGRFLRLALVAPFVGQRMLSMEAKDPRDPMALLSGFIEAGQVVPVVDRTFDLGRVPEAIRYLEEGVAVGKIVVTM